MKAAGLIIGFILIATVLGLLASGVMMIIIGAVGHIFNIAIFTYISFWETFILSIIFGFFAGGTAATANQ